jgi:thiol-disulfide isomerase/thioredoxin
MQPSYYLFSVCLLTLLLSPAKAVSTEVRGIVLDDHGLPAANVTVAAQWRIEDTGTQTALIPGTTTTLANGAFSLSDGLPSEGRFALLVYNKSHRQAALVDLPVTESGKPLTIRLQPVQVVHYGVRVPESETAKSSSLELFTSSGIPIVSLARVADGSCALPPGHYVLRARISNSETAVSSFSVATKPVNLQPLRIQQSAIARHYGRGTPDLSIQLLTMDQKPVMIHHTQGEWLLLYFWETSCVPCINKGIPQLIAFMKSHKDSPAPFRILAIGDCTNWQEFHDQSLRLQSDRWHVASLPFEVLVDQSSRLTSAWGVKVFPTYALIDPDGNLVPDATLKTLGEKIGN